MLLFNTTECEKRKRIRKYEKNTYNLDIQLFILVCGNQHSILSIVLVCLTYINPISISCVFFKECIWKIWCKVIENIMDLRRKKSRCDCSCHVL